MYHNKRKTYPGRKVVRGIEVIIVVAVALFGLAALDEAFRSRETPRSTERVVITQYDLQPQYNYTQPVTPAEPAAPARVYTAHDYFMMGLEDQQNRNYKGAIEDYTRAIQLDPSFAASWLNRGVAYEQLSGKCGRSRSAAVSDMWEWVSRNSIEIRTTDITPGTSLTLDMNEGRMYIIPFVAEAGDVVTVRASSVVSGEPNTPGVVDPLLVILNPADRPVAARDDTLERNGDLISMNPTISNYMIMQDGTYSIVVSHAGGGSVGAMNVFLDIR
jgi:tetratricopeptide (TPR) repeat protein